MGKYVTSTMTDGESVAYEACLHWIIYVGLWQVLTLFISPWIRAKTTELAITNRRIVVKTGLISRETMELNLSRVESVQVLGRMLGYGTVVLVGTGGTREYVTSVRNPLEFRRRYQAVSA